jgi:hypothetical protein
MTNTMADNPACARSGERGAALITALMVSMLMLVAGGALLVTTGLTAGNAADSTAEAQAYYAAESGLEAALTVARGNVPSNPGGTAATFRNLVCGTATLCTTNSGDLSLWLTYTNGVVKISDSPQISFTVSVYDPSPNALVNLADPTYSPRYLMVRSTGLGPKGSRKIMEMKLDAFPFDFTTHAAVAVRSNDSDMVGMTAFTIGSSAPHNWSGNDLAGLAPPLPAFAVTNTKDYDAGDGFGATTVQGMGEAAIASDMGNISGSVPLAKLSPSGLESWLQTADNARAFINALRQRASSMGRLNPTDIGSSSSPKFSFFDGDFSLGGNTHGAGLLVVTGTLTQSGNSGFDGIVLALGDGNISRNGTPDALGAVVLANFDHTLNSDGTYTGTGGFGSPGLTSNGGGHSTVGYDSSWVKKALNTLGSRPLGKIEK